MQITKGKITRPVRALVYGPEGIGKSTFASRWPAPLIIDTEDGTAHLDVQRFRPESWAAVIQAVDDISADPRGFKTLVIDTADWAEKLCIEHVLLTVRHDKGHQVKGIEEYGYGKGYTHLAEEWKRMLDRLLRLQEKTGMHVLFVAHATVRSASIPEELNTFDHWECKVSKLVGAATKEWCDMVLFIRMQTIVVATDNNRTKVQGGKRVMNANRSVHWDAKNRFGLPDEMPLDFASLAPVFAAEPSGPPSATVIPESGPDPASDLAPAEAPKTQPAITPAKAGLLSQLAQLMTTTGITKEELGAELARKGVVPADMNPREYNEATLARVVANWAAVRHNIQLRRQPAVA